MLKSANSKISNRNLILANKRMNMRIFNLLIVLCLLMSSCTPSPSGPLIIGHRGAMGYETENTLASVQKALDLGVDMIEIDVFQIRSGEIVVFHDERVDRLANSGGRIEEYYFLDLKNHKYYKVNETH